MAHASLPRLWSRLCLPGQRRDQACSGLGLAGLCPVAKGCTCCKHCKAANTGLDSVRVPGDWPAVPQPPGSRPGLQAPGVGAVRGRSAPDAVGARPWGRAGRERGGHGRTRAASSLRTVRGQRPGSPRGRLLWGRLLSPRACLSSAPPTPPRARKGHFTGNRPMASKLVEKSSPFSLHHILYSKQELQEARTNACLHYCCSRRPRIMTPGIGGLMTKKESMS